MPARRVIALRKSCHSIIHFLLWPAGLLATPCLVYLLIPPSVKQTPEAPVAAKAALQQLGRFTQDEIIMMAAILVAVLLWVSHYAGRHKSMCVPSCHALNQCMVHMQCNLWLCACSCYTLA